MEKGADHGTRRHKSESKPRALPATGGGGGGGLGSPTRRFSPPPPAWLLPAAAVLVALTALSAAPSATAAPECGSTSGPSVTGTPAGTPNTWTFSGVHTSTSGNNVIDCDGLTAGLTLTIEAGAEIGTAAKPAHENGIFVDAENDGDNDLMIINSGTIRIGTTGAQKRGIKVWHNGAGLLKVEHKAGKIVAPGPDSQGISVNHEGKMNTKAKGIHIVSAAEIDLSSATNRRFGPYGIYGQNIGAKTGSDTPIKIEMTGGVIKNPVTNAKGIVAVQHLKGDITIAIAAAAQIGTEDSPIGEYGVFTDVKSAATGAVEITNAGMIYAAKDGIYVQQVGTGDVTVTNDGSVNAVRAGIRIQPEKAGRIVLKHNAGGKIAVTGSGASDAGIGVIYKVPNTAGDRSTMIESAGDISAPAAFGILAWQQNHAAATTQKAPITVHVKGGTIEAGKDGIYAVTLRYNSGNIGSTVDYDGGKIAVTVDHGATVTAKEDGIHVNSGTLEGGMRAQTVIVRGKVMGGDAADDGTKYAGVHMVRGGTVVIGPKAHVSATSGVAIKANAEGDMVVILEKDADGFVGHVDGTILNTATTTFRTRTGQDADTEMALTVGDMVNRRGETKGVYEDVFQATLTKITGGHEFEEQSARLYHDRARVYEALPSVLLDLTGQASYQERMAAPRAGKGVWARLWAGDGERAPDAATTAQGIRGRALAWDVAQYGFEGGLDFRPAATERLLLGVSLHVRQGEATVAHGGTIEVSGFGGGVSATYRDAAGVYLDGRFSYTYFDDVDLSSRTRGMVQSDLSGHGYALGLEAGKRLGWAGLAHVALTPRARVVWSTVKLEDFADLAGVAGSGRVALETATSLKGRLGLLTETAFGGATLEDWTGDGGRLFGSLDVEHEFSADRETRASGTALASEVQATWGRVGLGGAVSWTEGLTLSGEGFYATAGSANTDFGGSLTLTLRF